MRQLSSSIDDGGDDNGGNKSAKCEVETFCECVNIQLH